MSFINKEEKHDKLEKLKHMKVYFLISFGVSFILLLISTLLCMVFQDAQIQFAAKFFGMESDDYGQIVIFLLGFWKILIVQFTLIPALALMIIEKHCHSCKGK